MQLGRKGFWVAICCLVAQAGLAQDNAVPEKGKWQVRDLSFQYGLNTRVGTLVQTADFAKLMPDSEILKRDLSGFNRTSSTYIDPVSAASVLVGFNLRDYDAATSRPLHQFRVGLTYFSNGGLYNSYSRLTRTPSDTLTSPQTGQQIFLDSVHHEHISMGYSAEQIHLDASYLLRFNLDARFSFFTGFGATAGFSLNSYSNVSDTHWGTLEGRDAGGNYIYLSNSSGASHRDTYEAVTNKTSYGFSAYVPIGIDFRVSRRGNLFSKMHLFLETRPGINFLVVPELRTFKKAQQATSLGLRIKV